MAFIIHSSQLATRYFDLQHFKWIHSLTGNALIKCNFCLKCQSCVVVYVEINHIFGINAPLCFINQLLCCWNRCFYLYMIDLRGGRMSPSRRHFQEGYISALLLMPAQFSKRQISAECFYFSVVFLKCHCVRWVQITHSNTQQRRSNYVFTLTCLLTNFNLPSRLNKVPLE